MSSIVIRDALNHKDRVPIEKILRESGAFRDPEILVGLELVDETLNPRPDTDYQWFLADQDEKLLGFACFGPVPMTEGTFDLYWIAVDLTARGSGVAKMLDDAVAAKAREQNGRWVLAETSSTEPYAAARKFYARQGYTLVERIPDFYCNGDARWTFGKRIDRTD